jgi:hypothetical protein
LFVRAIDRLGFAAKLLVLRLLGRQASSRAVEMRAALRSRRTAF